MNMRWIPWALIADALLACVPMIDARIIYGLWGSIIVYVVALTILQVTDNFALGKKWRMWWRITVKVLIVVGLEVAVSTSATETCDVAMANCHRIFSHSVLFVVVLAVLIITTVTYYLFSRPGKFWRVAAKNADFALILFSKEPHCLIDQEPLEAQRSEYVGPFKLMDRSGRKHRVYIDDAHIDEIQGRMMQELRGVSTHGKANAYACVVHVLDPTETSPRTENWNIDEHISRETYEKFKDSKGELHVLIFYEKGESRSSFVQKEIWEQAAQRLAAMDHNSAQRFERSKNAAGDLSFLKDRKEISDEEAAAQFVIFIVKASQKGWPKIQSDIKGTFDPQFAAVNELMAPFDLALASIALNSQAARNLFSSEQANRIENLILKCINSGEYGAYATNEVRHYWELMLKEKDANPLDLLSAVSVRLLRHWLGDGIKKFVDARGYVNPLVLMYMNDAVIRLGGMYWKALHENCEIIQGDLPV